MFLNRFLKKFLKRRFAIISPVGARERGSTLVGVLGVMGVASVIGVTSTSMSVHALGFTTSTLAGVQAQAAAEAGIDFAASNLSTLACQSQYSSTSAPIFSVDVAYSTLPAAPGDNDTSWVSGCPTFANAQRLKLISTGWTSALGVAGNSSGNIRKVEAIYLYTPAPPQYAIIPSGPTLYSWAQTDPTINNLTITQASTVRPIIQYLSGGVTCTSGSTIVGDVVLGAGAIAITSGCTIDGDLWASSGVSIQSGRITGNVHSAGMQNGTSVSLSSSAIIDGSIFATGPVSIAGIGKVGGNIVAGPSGGTSTFSNQSSVGGSVITAGTVSARAGVIKGTISMNLSGIVTPTIPVVPPWIDFAYSASDWKTSTGAPYTVLAMSTCSSITLANALDTVQNSTGPIVLDTRTCGAATDLRGYNLTLKSDAVIITNGFDLGSNNIQSSNTSEKRLWIIIPDTVADGQPICPAGSYARIGNNVTVVTYVGAMIYSPCPISISGSVWRGQMYASSVSSSSSFTFNYLPIGLPTVNLSTGQFLPPPGTGVLGGRTSIRDLVNG